MASDAARHWIIATFAVVPGFAAIANALRDADRASGLIGMSAVVVLAIAGY